MTLFRLSLVNLNGANALPWYEICESEGWLTKHLKMVSNGVTFVKGFWNI